MSMWGRLKSMVGGRESPSTLASAATLALKDEENTYYLSGTTTITSITTPVFIRNRKISFIGASGCNVTFTNTNTPTTSGQMYLHGANRQIQESDVIELFCDHNGYWILWNLVN